MNYRSINDLNRALLGWKPRLLQEVDLLVGVPHSGLLVANLLALQLGVPMTDVTGLLQRRLLNHGHRAVRKVDLMGQAPVRILLVDDLVHSGATLDRVRRAVADADLPHHIRYAAPYVAPGAEGLVDLYHEVLPTPRLLQWNVLQPHTLERACVDIDGVLCRDPDHRENDDGPAYARFLGGVESRVRGPLRVGWLVTNRLERWRPETEAWLASQGIVCTALIMRNLPDAAARRRAGLYGRHKADAYRGTGADIFIESDARQAAEIAGLSGRPVFCTDTRRLVRPGDPVPPLPAPPLHRRLLRAGLRAVQSLAVG